jgi:hypothetical protein
MRFYLTLNQNMNNWFAGELDSEEIYIIFQMKFVCTAAGRNHLLTPVDRKHPVAGCL